MAQICVDDLTFYYEGSYDNIFENVSFSIDTDWKLGFLGRNGKGKTTFLRLLQGKLEYRGSIQAGMAFDYFPYSIGEEDFLRPASEFLEKLKSECEEWRVLCEMDKLGIDAEKLYRPFGTLSFGEQTKVMLAVLFSSSHDFLLIDEPTNHLDQDSRETVKKYLAMKKGFILVSHDRDLLDGCIDHVLVLNRHSIEVEAGNFSSWWENKSRTDAFRKTENEKHKKEISKLQAASRRTSQWAQKSEGAKIGYDPVKEHDRGNGTRPYIGAKTKKLQKRVKQLEVRMQRELEEKEHLLWDIEDPADLKLVMKKHVKEVLVSCQEYGLRYEDGDSPLFEHLSFEVRQGERVFLNGKNGCGKSSLIRAVLKNVWEKEENPNGWKLREKGILRTASGLTVSYVSQDTSFLKGSLKEFCEKRNLSEQLFYAILRKLDLERTQLKKAMEDFSEGQKKKVLLAASLMTPSHLYIWDEPLNYIDVFSRMQIEKLLLAYRPTMLVVEHDPKFREQIATKVVEM